jgi:hypothetical protein
VQCEEAYHLDCLDPPVQSIPEGDWFCPECALEGEGGLHQPFRPSTEWIRAKKKGWKATVPAVPSPSADELDADTETQERREGSPGSHSECICLVAVLADGQICPNDLESQLCNRIISCKVVFMTPSLWA